MKPKVIEQSKKEMEEALAYLLGLGVIIETNEGFTVSPGIENLLKLTNLLCVDDIH